MDKGVSLICASPMVLELITIKMQWTWASRSSFPIMPALLLQVARIKARYSTSLLMPLLSSLKLLRMRIRMECQPRVVFREQWMDLPLIPGIHIPNWIRNMMRAEVALHQVILELIKAIPTEDKKMWSYARIPQRHLGLPPRREAEMQVLLPKVRQAATQIKQTQKRRVQQQRKVPTMLRMDLVLEVTQASLDTTETRLKL